MTSIVRGDSRLVSLRVGEYSRIGEYSKVREFERRVGEYSKSIGRLGRIRGS